MNPPDDQAPVPPPEAGEALAPEEVLARARVEALGAAPRALLQRAETRSFARPLVIHEGRARDAAALVAAELAQGWTDETGHEVLALTALGQRAARAVRAGAAAAKPTLRAVEGSLLAAVHAADAADAGPDAWRGDPGPDLRGPDPRDGGGGRPAEPDRQPGDIYPGCPVQALGVHGKMFYYLDYLRQLREVDNHTRDAMRGIFGGRQELLKSAFPRWSKGGEETPPKVIGWDQESAATAMMRACAERGVWSPRERLRGLGAWPDEDGGIVLHCGDKILSRGEWCDPGDIDGYVYPGDTGTPRPRTGDPRAAQRLLDRLGSWSWEREDLDAALALGWIVAAMVGGALRWRPLVWITGDRGSGKSSLQDLMEMVLGGRGAVLKSSDPTAPGIWQVLLQSTMPVLLDELEASADNRRVLDVVKLARQAASGGVILRGGADHKGHEFKARSAFAFSSILVPPLLDQDISRIALLKLRPLDRSLPRLDLVEADWRAVGQALRGSVLEQWARWSETLGAYREALIRQGHDSRSADQYGTLLAAVDLVLETAAPDRARADDWARRLVVEDLREQTDELSDWHRCLNHLLGAHVDIYRSGERYTLGRWILAAAGLRDVPDPVKAVSALPAYGLRVEGRGDQARIMVANSHPGLAGIFRETHWQGGVWAQAVSRVPCATRMGPRTYDGVSSRGWSLPLTSIPDLFGDGAPAPAPAPAVDYTAEDFA